MIYVLIVIIGVISVIGYLTIVKMQADHDEEIKRVLDDAKQERERLNEMALKEREILYARIMSRDEAHFQASQGKKQTNGPKPKNFIKKSLDQHEKQNRDIEE